MIDSHCHLADKKFVDDLSSVMKRAKAIGVDRMICIADSISEAKRCIEIADEYPEVYCTIGIHPHVSKEWEEGSRGEILSLIQSSKKALAVGEIGLDHHYDFSPREKQHEAFRAQIAIAKELKLPAVVHCREAIEDIRAIVEELQPPKVVLHCCTEHWEDVEPLVAQGHLLSFTGIATFPQSEEIRRTIRECPLSQIMIETDSPYLAPVPHRGKRNEPAFVIEVAKCIAEIKDISIAYVDTVTTKNAIDFFRLPPLSAAEVPS